MPDGQEKIEKRVEQKDDDHSSIWSQLAAEMSLGKALVAGAAGGVAMAAGAKVAEVAKDTSLLGKATTMIEGAGLGAIPGLALCNPIIALEGAAIGATVGAIIDPPFHLSKSTRDSIDIAIKLGTGPMMLPLDKVQPYFKKGVDYIISNPTIHKFLDSFK